VGALKRRLAETIEASERHREQASEYEAVAVLMPGTMQVQ